MPTHRASGRGLDWLLSVNSALSTCQYVSRIVTNWSCICLDLEIYFSNLNVFRKIALCQPANTPKLLAISKGWPNIRIITTTPEVEQKPNDCNPYCVNALQ